MATAYPIEAGNEDNYELELSRVREKIKTKFVELIDCLKARESELLRELDDILASYLSYRSELEKARNKVESLNVMKQQQEEAIMSSPVKPFIERLLNEINAEPKSIGFSFECLIHRQTQNQLTVQRMTRRTLTLPHQNQPQSLLLPPASRSCRDGHRTSHTVWLSTQMR